MSSTPIAYYNKHQIDSVCFAEKIPTISNDKWLNSSFKDEHLNKFINQYTFIIRNDNIEKSYFCTDCDSIYRFNIRTLKRIKK